MGASRYRRNRHGVSPNRDQQELGLRLWGALTERTGGEILRKIARRPMTEILFYHLQRQPIEGVLPVLLEKSIGRGWGAVGQAVSEWRIEALDSHLWTFRDDSFLPHGTWRETESAAQPIVLTVHDDNPNGATVRFLIDGLELPADAGSYERIVILFDGEDSDAVEAARQRWTASKAQGFDVTYWQADDQGRWRRMG